MTSEMKVGTMLVVAIGLALTFTVFTTPSLQRSGAYHVSFPRVARLKAGDPVTYNGVAIGRVSAVRPILGPDGLALVDVEFSVASEHREKVLVGGGTRYQIRQGVLGGAEMEIQGREGIPITPEALVQVRGDTPTNIDEAIESVQKLVEENRAEVKRAITTLREGMESFGSMSKEIREAVAENRTGLKKAVDNVGAAAGSIDAVVQENRRNVADAIANFKVMAAQVGDLVAENRTAVAAAIASFTRAGDKVGDAAATIDGTVQENRADLRTTLQGTAALGKRLDRIGGNVEAITDQVASGQGTLGRLVMEEAIADKTERVLDSAERRLEEIRPFTSGLSDTRFYVGLAPGSNLRTGSATGEAYLRIEPRPWKLYEGGVSYRTAPSDVKVVDDNPDKLGIDFNFRFGWRFFRDDAAQTYRLTVAGGVYESRLGGDVSVNLTPDLSLRLLGRMTHNTRKPDDRRYEDGSVMLRATAEYRLWQRVYVVAGASDLANQPGPWLGLRAELLDDDIRAATTVMSLGL